MTLANFKNRDWLKWTLKALSTEGYIVLEDFLSPSETAETRDRIYAVKNKIAALEGTNRQVRVNEYGILRALLKYDPYFTRFLERPEVLAIIDNTISNTAILHVQTGIVLPSFSKKEIPEKSAQFRLHRDFPRYLNGYLAAINLFVALDEFSEKTGGTRVVPRSQQKAEIPSEKFLQTRAKTVACPAGSMIVYDSTLWHGSGVNTSGRDRIAMNHFFTRSFFKQQFDFPRLLGDDFIRRQKPRTQQILGYYTRVPASFDEYYKPEEERFYRAGQG
jgi:ectoine hydroxylase-related dioxygenase (phytanoyl-CoA dioxygenase family)